MFNSVSLTITWWLVAVAYLVGSFCLFSSFQVLHHRTGAYGGRNWLVLLTSSLLYTIALFTSTVVSLLAVSFSSLASPTSLTLTVDPLIAFVSFFVPFIFILFGLFLCGHPDSHRYLRRPIGALVVGVGTTASQFLLVVAVHLQATFVLVEGYVIGVVAMGCLAVPVVLYLMLHQQQKHRGNVLSRVLFAATLGLCVEVMHVLALKAMTWTYSADVTTDYPLSPLIIPLAILSALSLVALVVSFVLTRMTAFKDHQTSQSFSLSAYIMDSDRRVLVTSSGALPSVKIENVYIGQGAFDCYNKDFIRLLQTSLHWHDAFTTLHTITASDDIPPSSVLVFSQFLHSACQLAHTLQLSLSHLGFLYKSPVDDRLILISTAAHAGRMTENGLYRWAPREVVNEFLTKAHGPLRLDTHEKMVQVLGEEYLDLEGDDCGWVREIERYYGAYQLTIDQRRVSPRTSIDIRIAIPSLIGLKGTDGTISPRSRGISTPGLMKSGAVTPVSQPQHTEAAVTAVSFANDRARGLSNPIELVRATEEGMRVDRKTTVAFIPTVEQWPGLPEAVKALSDGSAPSTPKSDGCHIYVGMFLAKVTGIQLSIMLSRYGASHCIPCVRLRLPSATPKTALTEQERQWLAGQMQDQSTASLAISSNLPSFPPPTSSVSDELARFQRSFFAAVAELSVLLGGGKHVAFGKLLSVHPVQLSEGVSMLVFCESVMTPHFPLGYNKQRLTFLPSKVFEALHSSRWPSALPQDWIAQALQATTRSNERSRAWGQSQEEFLFAGSMKALKGAESTTAAAHSTRRTRTPATELHLVESGTRGSDQPTSRAVTPHESRHSSRPASRPPSRPSSRPKSEATSPRGGRETPRSASRSGSRRSSGYEMKEKTVLMNGQLMVLVKVHSAEEEREREEKQRRRRERKQRQELELQQSKEQHTTSAV